MPKRPVYFEEVVRFRDATKRSIGHMETYKLPDGSSLTSIAAEVKRLNLLRKALRAAEKLIDELEPPHPQLPMD